MTSGCHSSFTPGRSSSPELPVQPDHFYGADNSSVSTLGSGIQLRPEDDPLAQRGIPVFRPTMEEFEDFETYMMKVECWGSRSGIIKIIPPKEWRDSLPPLKEQLNNVKIKTPIEQHMLGSGGLFRQENMEKRKIMSVREWAELCSKEEFQAPGIDDVGSHARSTNVKPRAKRTRKKAEVSKTEDPSTAEDDGHPPGGRPSPAVEANEATVLKAEPTDDIAEEALEDKDEVEDKPKVKGRRTAQTREAREASLADRAARDLAFLDNFEPHVNWLPPNTQASDYTPEFCKNLERHYWRNCGLGRPAWYGADTQGSLFTDETTSWNVAHLQSTLTRLLPASDKGLPGVNTPYLYFGMWKATFAWHVEDMDLFSINYIHFGAPKFWYAVPQGRASALEQTMRGYFPKDTSQCHQFLRHKSFLASPNLLANSSCRPNHLVQHAGEFVVTFPRGYHAGFNTGFNCAESVNFALESWLELGKRAKACECVSDSVRIDVNQLLTDRALESESAESPIEVTLPEAKSFDSKPSRKRRSANDQETKTKRIKVTVSPPRNTAFIELPAKRTAAHPPRLSVTLKLGPRPPEPEPYPCCLCVSNNRDGLLSVLDPPTGRKDIFEAAGSPKVWMAHEDCANIVPETWVDEADVKGHGRKERVVFGVDGIVKDRWNLKCSACTKARPKAHGAPIQCTKGKCPKAFHVSCAKDGKDLGIIFSVIREVEKEVVIFDAATPRTADISVDSMQVDNPNEQVSSAVSPAECSTDSGSRVLKTIKKYEVQVLCTQHNPDMAAAKKNQKQEKIKQDLLALPSMARIKIRVSAGVFEVSLVRVHEETSSVEVLWDRGVKREFKWGSVVFGSTDGPVQQKPSEPLEPEQPSVSAPVLNYESSRSSLSVPTPQPVMASLSPPGPSSAQDASVKHFATNPPYPYPPYNYWPYQGHATHTPYSPIPSHPYPGYYPAPRATAVSQYAGYNYASQYRNSQFQWQPPYQGPRPGADYFRPTSNQPNTMPSPLASTSQPSSHDGSVGSPQQSNATDPPNAGTPESPAPLTPQASHSVEHETDHTMLAVSSDLQVAVKDFNALASMDPAQLDTLIENPQLRQVVVDAIEQARKTIK